MAWLASSPVDTTKEKIKSRVQIEKLKAEIDSNYPKVRLIRNISNQGCYLNKFIAVGQCKSEFVIIFDSDNVMCKEYLDALFLYAPFDERTIYAPDFLKPHFDYTKFSGLTINRSNVAEIAKKPLFDCVVNSCNYVVPRLEFCNTFDVGARRYADDTAYINLRWLQAGNQIYIVPNMQYDHEVHSGSHYQKYAVESQSRLEDIIFQFKTMS